MSTGDKKRIGRIELKEVMIINGEVVDVEDCKLCGLSKPVGEVHKNCPVEFANADQ